MKNFVELDNNEMLNIDGGSVTVALGLIGIGVVGAWHIIKYTE